MRYLKVSVLLIADHAPRLTKEERTREIAVGPFTSEKDRQEFQRRFAQETTVVNEDRRGKEKKENLFPALRFWHKEKKAANTAITPEEALSLSWVPEDWKKSPVTATAPEAAVA